jgi:hypothetical protein
MDPDVVPAAIYRELLEIDIDWKVCDSGCGNLTFHFGLLLLVLEEEEEERRLSKNA